MNFISNQNCLKPEEDKQNIKDKIIENLNSPQLIQEIINLNSPKNKVEIKLENKIVKSLTSFNNIFVKSLDDDIVYYNNFNPLVESLKQRNNLYKLNFEKNNFNQKNLDNQIKLYNELNQKLSNYKNDLNENNIQDEDKIKIKEELLIYNHPLINLFKDKINLT